MENNSIFVLAIIFGIIGLSLVVTGGLLAVPVLLKNKRCSKQVGAEITELNLRSVYDHGRMVCNTRLFYIPTLRYSANGRLYTAPSKESLSTDGGHRAGDMLIIYYNPDNPLEFTFKDNYFGPILGGIMGTIGIIFTAIAIILICYS